MPNYRSARYQGINSLPLRGKTTSYANTSVLPLSGNQEGDLAFVESPSRLYVWGGTGWYNIALVNQSPSTITGNNATYTLSTSGTPTVVSLNSTDPEGIPLTWSYSVTSGTLGNTAVITQTSNVFTITPSVNFNDGGNFTLTFSATDGINTETATSSFSLEFAADPGGVLFTTTGTHSWTCPAGVTSVCVVAIGAGSAGVWGQSRGGCGGGLGWKNNISVTPGQTYTVVVGAGSTYDSGNSGGSSYFISAGTVSGGGGTSSGGTYVGDGGGNGGGGGTGSPYTTAGAGGGGAGGYSGNGGAGGTASSTAGFYAGSNGSGGGGGGGGTEQGGGTGFVGTAVGGGGGGVGVYGQGSSGSGGSTSSRNGKGGSSGSSGGSGIAPGGLYGGGGGYSYQRLSSGADYLNTYNNTNSKGANGAVRIIWGAGRAFPSTNVTTAFSTTAEQTI